MKTDKKIIIPGAAGLVGQNLIIALKDKGYKMRQVWEAQMKKAGKVDESALDDAERRVVEAMEARSHALANTARVWDDALIDPRDTRDVVAFVLSVCLEADARIVNANTFGIARF